MVKISIGSLSKAALKKLKDGLPVRVKHGDSLEVEVDVDKAKKLKKRQMMVTEMTQSTADAVGQTEDVKFK